jgi:hypothetical protein
MRETKRSVLTLAVYILLRGAASAQGDITGAWEVTVDSPQGAATIDVAFKQVGEVVTGAITTPMGVVDFKGTLIDDALRVSSAFEIQGNKLDFALTATVTGDTMAGKILVGGLGEVPWTAKRKILGAASPASQPAQEAVTAADVSGKWEIKMNLGGAAFSTIATLKQVGEQVTGTLGGQAGEEPVTGTMVGKTLRLHFRAATSQGDAAIIMRGDLGAEGLSGKVSIPGMAEADWTGTRSK